MSKTVNYRDYLDQKGDDDRDQARETAYERAYSEQRKREAAIWDRRRKSGSAAAPNP